MSGHPMDRLLDSLDWQAVPEPDRVLDDLPYVTHQGVFRMDIDAPELRCYQLSDGQRVFDPEDVTRFFEWLEQ